MIRVYDDAGNVIETHEYTGDFNFTVFAVTIHYVSGELFRI